MVLGQEVELRLRRLDGAAPGLLPRSDRDLRLLQLVALPARVIRGVHERRQAIHLVLLEDVHPCRGGHDQHPHDRCDRDEPDHEEMGPPRAGDEQHRAGDRQVDHPRAQVRLQHDEHRRQDRQQQDPARRLLVVQAADTVDDERRQRHHQQHLAELRRLELEEGEVDPVLRSAGRRADGERQQDQRDREAVDAELQLAQPRIVEAREQQHQHDADAAVCGLADQVVVGIPGDVTVGGGADHVDAGGRQRDRGDKEQEVELEHGGGEPLLRLLEALDLGP